MATRTPARDLARGLARLCASTVRLSVPHPLLGMTAAACFALALVPTAAHAQSGGGEQAAPAAPAAPAKVAVAVPTVKALPAVLEKVAGYGQQNELAQIVQGFEGKLSDALHNTRKFDVRVHAELAKIIGEQQAQDSGNYDLSDPNRAKPFKLAGIPYLALVQIDDFQDQVQSASFDGVGAKMTRRQIRLSAVCRIYDATKGTLLESAKLTVSEFDAKNNPQAVKEQKGGDLTEAVINLVADKMASKVAQKITDTIFPAKVLVVRDGVVTLNRGEGTDIAVGEIWEAFALGEALIDPDTGESLGAEEVAIGFVQIDSIAPKFSKAKVCGGDRGIAKECVLRKTTKTSCPSADGARMYKPVASEPEETPAQQDAAPPLRGGRGASEPADSERQAERSKPATASDAKTPYAAAVFVRNYERRIGDDAVMKFNDYITSALDNTCFTTMDREDTINAVRNFAREGANAGTKLTDAELDEQVDKVLSDNTSALNLAQAMGADYVLVVSITSLDLDTRVTKDLERGIDTTVEIHSLDVTYRLLDRADGRVVATDQADASMTTRQGGGVTIVRDVLPKLFKESAGKLAGAVKARCDKGRIAAPSELVMVPLQIDAGTSDFALPEIVKDDKGNWTVSSGKFKLAPTEFMVEVDSMLKGSTPVEIKLSKGIHNLTIKRPDYETLKTTVNVQPGQGPIKVTMKMTDEGLRRIAEMTAFFQALKQGQQLTDAQVKVLEGYAEFFKNSKYSIDQKTDIKVDTKEAPAITNNNSFWRGVPWTW